MIKRRMSPRRQHIKSFDEQPENDFVAYYYASDDDFLMKASVRSYFKVLAY